MCKTFATERHIFTVVGPSLRLLKELLLQNFTHLDKRFCTYIKTGNIIIKNNGLLHHLLRVRF